MRRIKGLFPRPVSFRAEFQDVVGERFLEPRLARITTYLLRFRSLQPGFLSIYILYVLLTLLAVFLWVFLRGRLLG